VFLEAAPEVAATADGRASDAVGFEQRFRVPDRGFRLADRDPADDAGLSREQATEQRAADIERLAEFQDRLYAEGRRALLVLQGLDLPGRTGRSST
jgi:polyphosphate kinase 2 (PPK2 family)